MNSNTCRHARREIDELEIGQQPGEQTMAHMAVCPACSQFRSERANLRELIGGLEPVVAPADFDMRLRARIAREGAVADRQPFFSRLIGVPAIAMAAVVVMAIATVVWVGQKNDQSTTATQTAPASKTDQVATNTGNQSVTVAPVTTNDSVEGSDIVAGGKGSFSGRRNRVRSGGSRDYGVIGVETVRQNDSFVNAPSKPVVVSLEDNNGTKRKISLPPVSFGAQSLVDNRIPVSYTGNGRVW